MPAARRPSIWNTLDKIIETNPGAKALIITDSDYEELEESYLNLSPDAIYWQGATVDLGWGDDRYPCLLYKAFPFIKKSEFERKI